MSTKQYETRCATIVVYGNGKFRVISDGLLPGGDYTQAEIQSGFEQLNQSGWKLVSSIDHRGCNGPSPSMDLYFRREKKESNLMIIGDPAFQVIG